MICQRRACLFSCFLPPPPLFLLYSVTIPTRLSFQPSGYGGQVRRRGTVSGECEWRKSCSHASVTVSYCVCSQWLQTIKLRVNSAPTPMERRFGAWIGGSILASLVRFYHFYFLFLATICFLLPKNEWKSFNSCCLGDVVLFPSFPCLPSTLHYPSSWVPIIVWRSRHHCLIFLIAFSHVFPLAFSNFFHLPAILPINRKSLSHIAIILLSFQIGGF